jgi:DNA-binding XRE family transcriptional regulator
MKKCKVPEGCRTFDEVIAEKLKDEKFAEAWNAVDAEFAAGCALLELRLQSNETQQNLAERLNTKQAYISRVETGRVSPTIGYIAKMAAALDADVEIIFRPRRKKTEIKAVLVKGKTTRAKKTPKT